MTGIQVTYLSADYGSSQAAIYACIGQLQSFANDGSIQEWNGHVGAWWHNVSNPSETGPAPVTRAS